MIFPFLLIAPMALAFRALVEFDFAAGFRGPLLLSAVRAFSSHFAGRSPIMLWGMAAFYHAAMPRVYVGSPALSLVFAVFAIRRFPFWLWRGRFIAISINISVGISLSMVPLQRRASAFIYAFLY